MDFERLMLGSLIRKRPGPRPCEHSRAALSRYERFSCHLRARRSSFCSLPRQNEFHLQKRPTSGRAKARQIAGGAKVDGPKARAAIVFAFLLLAGMLAQKADLLLRDANIDAAVDWAWHRFIHGLRGAHARLYPVIRGQPGERAALASHRPRDFAIDPDVLAGDISGSLRGEECDRRGNFLARAIALERHALASLLGRGKAVDPTGEVVIHPHVVARKGVRENLCEGGEPGTEYRRGREHGARLEGPGRGDVDDDARFLLLHHGCHEPRWANDVHEIGV